MNNKKINQAIITITFALAAILIVIFPAALTYFAWSYIGWASVLFLIGYVWVAFAFVTYFKI